MVVKDLQTTTNTTSDMRKAFASILEPLERRSGSRLGEPARGQCFAAFLSNPDGVREVARASLSAGRNPTGLLVYKLRAGHHNLEPLPQAEQHAAATSTSTSSTAHTPRQSTEWAPYSTDKGVPIYIEEDCVGCWQHRKVGAELLCQECWTTRRGTA